MTAQYRKKSRAGRNERIALLANICPTAAEMIGRVRRAGMVEADDILDALAGAWTAAKAVIGHVATLPEHPTTDSKGLRMEIVRPRL